MCLYSTQNISINIIDFVIHYAHRELNKIEKDETLTQEMNAAYEAAKHLAPNGKSYPTAHAWKFNCLIHEYKQANPMEQGK